MKYDAALSKNKKARGGELFSIYKRKEIRFFGNHQLQGSFAKNYTIIITCSLHEKHIILFCLRYY